MIRNSTFLQRIGRTNTEYGTVEPIYGHSISKLNVPKSQKGSDFTAFEYSEIVSQSVWSAGAEVGLEGLEGKVYHMLTYVPSVSSAQARFDLFQEEFGTGKRYFILLNNICTKLFLQYSYGFVLDSII